MNLYTYCKGNPVNLFDPSGHISIAIPWKSGLDEILVKFVKVGGKVVSRATGTFTFLETLFSDPVVCRDLTLQEINELRAEQGYLPVSQEEWDLNYNADDESQSEEGSTFKEKLEDIQEHPEDWEKSGESVTDSTKKGNSGGQSIEEQYTNKNTGEKIYKHTLTNSDGNPIEQPHYRPYPKQIGVGE